MTFTLVGVTALAEGEEESETGSVVEALLITENMDWGETLSTIRIEYSDEIFCGAYDITAQDFTVKGIRDIVRTYVNNSGKLDEVAPYGKYVFLELGTVSDNGNNYLMQVAFNEASSYRDKLNVVAVSQNVDMVARNGKVIPAGDFNASEGIRTDIDKFQNVYYTTVDDIDFYYNLFIPEGYEEKSDDLENLPIVVHYPSGDYACSDFNGIYNGALYRHPDCTVWASDDVQERHPAFVVTIGASSRIPNTMYGTFEEIWASQVYVDVVNELIDTYNIDANRIYCASLAGGTTMMWNTIMQYPDMFAASLSTSFDFYMSYPDPDVAFANMEAVLDSCPCWFFAGLYDSTGSDPFEQGRLKGERLRDIAYLVNEDGYKVEVGWGEEGELMWDGQARGAEAAAMAEAQIARAEENGNTSFVSLYYPNSLPTSQHWCWSASYSNTAVQDWLFSQTRE